jgi:hypothetical protein
MKTETKQTREYWVADGQICIVDGWGYAVSPGGRTYCVGTEEDIKKEINTPSDAVTDSPETRQNKK